MKIVITGLPRSGTTFLAHLFHKSGYVFASSDCHPDNIGKKKVFGAGCEDFKLARINTEIIKNPSEENVQKLHDYLENLNPDVNLVKDPRITHTIQYWLNSSWKDAHFFVCIRNRNEIIDSFNRHGFKFIKGADYAFEARRSMINLLQDSGAKVNLIYYPQIKKSEESRKVLSEYIPNIDEIIKKTWRDDMYMSFSKECKGCK